MNTQNTTDRKILVTDRQTNSSSSVHVWTAMQSVNQ